MTVCGADPEQLTPLVIPAKRACERRAPTQRTSAKPSIRCLRRVLRWVPDSLRYRVRFRDDSLSSEGGGGHPCVGNIGARQPVRFFEGVHLTAGTTNANYVNVMNIHME